MVRSNQSKSQRSADPMTTSTREIFLERMVLSHLILLLIGTTWAYGGNVDWARNLVGLWGSLSIPLLFQLSRERLKKRSYLPRVLFTLWPLVIFNGLILFSLFSPGFRVGYYEGEALLINNLVSPYLPSSAQPLVSLHALWIFDAIYLSCFNLQLGIKSRHSFRLLLFACSINAIALAVFGTLQKLVHSEGLYFGLKASPQPKFFSTFIYHNHWGAFTTLMVTLGLGLVFHYIRRVEGAAILKTPAVLVGTSVIFLAISVPLSASRSSSLMVAGLLATALVHWISLILKRYRRRHASASKPIGIAATVLLIVLGASYILAKPVIHERLDETKEQLAASNSLSGFGSRPILYRDTLSMAGDRILFGWGMGSYPVVFPLYNSSDVSPVDGLPMFFHDAHSDWLQSVAEVGIIGTVLLGLCALVPLWHFRQTLFRSAISNYLLGGCGLILLYAWLEFPFGNTAVVITFWTAFFTALSYGRIEANRTG